MEANLRSTCMKLLGRRNISLTDGRQRIWPVLGLLCVTLSPLIMLILMMIRVKELSLIIFRMESETLRYTLDSTLIAVKLPGENFTSSITSSFFISFALIITLSSYIVILLLRRTRRYYTQVEVSQSRRLESGYWSRRRIY